MCIRDRPTAVDTALKLAAKCAKSKAVGAASATHTRFDDDHSMCDFYVEPYKKGYLVTHKDGYTPHQLNLSTEWSVEGVNYKRPLFWNATLNGWVASSKHVDDLLDLGMVEVVFDDDEYVEDSFAYSDFQVAAHKNGYLVTHKDGYTCEELELPTEWSVDGVSYTRPLFWNSTLNGWVASSKHHSDLLELGMVEYVEDEHVEDSFAYSDFQVAVSYTHLTLPPKA